MDKIIRKIIKNFFDYIDAKIADKIIDDIKNKKMKVYCEEKTKKLLNLK